MKNILVLTDFSKVAEMATDYAIALAQQFRSEIHFLHTIGLSEVYSHRSYPLEIVRSIENRLIDHENKAADLGLPARHFTPINRPHFDIEGHVRDYEHDLVIIGSHGLDGINELFSQSNAQEIVRHCPCPVLVIKKKPKKVIFDHITFASRFFPDDHQPFSELLSFVATLKASLNLLYINTPYNWEKPDLIKQRMKAFAASHHLKEIQCFVEYNKSTEDGILSYLHSNQTDLFAIATHGRTGFGRLVQPNFTETLVNHMENPILTLRKGQDEKA